MSFPNRADIMSTPRTFYSLRLALLGLCLAILSACSTQAPITDDSATSNIPVASDLSPLDQNQYQSALASMNQGEFEKSRRILAKLTKKYPTHVAIKMNFATSLFKLNDLEAAKALCQAALSLSQDSPEAHNLLGLIAIEKREFKNAEQAYQKALSLNKSYANAHYNIALLYDIYFQDIPKAYQHYLAYLNLVPDDSDTKNWVNQLQYSLDRD